MRDEMCVLCLLVAATLACKEDKDPAESSADSSSACQTDADCKNGLLCESETCVPRAVAKKARRTSRRDKRPSSKEKAADRAEASPVQDDNPIPPIPTETSNPPQGTEWTKGQAVNTQHPASQPDKCDMRVLREWLQVTCRDDYSGYEKMENFGRKNVDYYSRVEPNQVVSFVLRLKQGKTQAIRICGDNKRASLFVNWPVSADRPTHIALGSGPACDGSAWGAAQKKSK